MDPVQEQHERAVIENFARWHNETHGTSWTYTGRPRTPTPDGLLRSEDGVETPIEVGDAYYDDSDAKMRWLPARGRPASDKWFGSGSDELLTNELSRIVQQKATKNYPQGTVLVLNVHPTLTTVEAMERLRTRIAIPQQPPFAAIYLFGDFPHDLSAVPVGQLVVPSQRGSTGGESLDLRVLGLPPPVGRFLLRPLIRRDERTYGTGRSFTPRLTAMSQRRVRPLQYKILAVEADIRSVKDSKMHHVAPFSTDVWTPPHRRHPATLRSRSRWRQGRKFRRSTLVPPLQ